MASNLNIVSAAVIDRPLAVVRAHFFDLNHHVRSNLFKGVRMAHLPCRVPGQRRVRQEVVVAGIPRISVIVVEEGPEGELVKRYVQGPFRGVEWRVRFAESEGQATRVEVTATVRAAGLRKLTMPVRRRALKRAVELALATHKHDLEVSGYQPVGDAS